MTPSDIDRSLRAYGIWRLAAFLSLAITLATVALLTSPVLLGLGGEIRFPGGLALGVPSLDGGGDLDTWTAWFWLVLLGTLPMGSVCAMGFDQSAIERRRLRGAGLDGRLLPLALARLRSSLLGLPQLGAALRSCGTTATAALSTAPLPLPQAELPSPERMREEVANAIRNARVRVAMTQEHLAAAASMSARTVQRIEATGRASFENLRALCSVLAIPVPVVPGQEAAVAEASSPFAGIGRPFLLIAATALSCGIVLGAFCRNWTERAAFLLGCAIWGGAMAQATPVVLSMVHQAATGPVSPAFEASLWWAMSTTVPVLGAAAVTLGWAWRVRSPRAAVVLALVAAALIGSADARFVEAKRQAPQLGIMGSNP